MSQTIEPITALAVIPPVKMPTLLKADTKDILGRLRDELRGYVPNAETPEGREKIGSMRRKVGIAKADFDRLRKSEAEDAKKTIDAINAEWKIIEANLNEIGDQIEAPRVAYLAAEKARVEANENAIAALEALADGLDTFSPDEIKARHESIQPFEWSVEFASRGERTRNGVVAQLQIAHQAAKVREAEAVAEAQRQAEAAEYERIALAKARELREEQIARDAAEAATRAAEAEAARKAEEAERTAQAEREAAAERERRQAEALAAAQRREREAKEKSERERVWRHEKALESIGGMIRDAVSPFNGSDMIRHITKVMDGMQEMTRDWEEYTERAETLIADGRKQIAKRLAVVVGQEEAARKKREDEAAAHIEADRIKAHEAALEDMDHLTNVVPGSSSDVIRATLTNYVQWSGHDRDWQEFREQHAKDYEAGQIRLDALLTQAVAREEERAEQLRAAAEKKAERDKQAAIEAERDRVTREDAAKKAEDDGRAANRAHRGAINRDVLAALMPLISKALPQDATLADALGRDIIEAVARGNIPRMAIDYASAIKGKEGALL